MSINQAYEGERLDLLIALHAHRSAASIINFHRVNPDKPIIVALTGTDLYSDLARSSAAREALKLATRIVVLQPKALDVLSATQREKTRVIYQSVAATRTVAKEEAPSTLHGRSSHSTRRLRPTPTRETRSFDVCVIGHLRPVKDPFRAAMAARLLPRSSRVRVLHAGRAMTEEAEARARAEMKRNRRYRWLGEQAAWRVRRILERSQLFVLASRMEGGANVLGEAIVAGTPVLASRIAGSVGILGDDYPGYFEVGDTSGLAKLMARAESDADFLAALEEHCSTLVRLFEPSREAAAWVKLLAELKR